MKNDRITLSESFLCINVRKKKPSRARNYLLRTITALKKVSDKTVSSRFRPQLQLNADTHMHIIPNQSFVTVHISDHGSRPHYKLNVANPTYSICLTHTRARACVCAYTHTTRIHEEKSEQKSCWKEINFSSYFFFFASSSLPDPLYSKKKKNSLKDILLRASSIEVLNNIIYI